MAIQDRAFSVAMQIVAADHPENFKIKEGDYYFFGWRIPGWLCVVLADELIQNVDVSEGDIRSIQEEAV